MKIEYEVQLTNIPKIAIEDLYRSIALTAKFESMHMTNCSSARERWCRGWGAVKGRKGEIGEPASKRNYLNKLVDDLQSDELVVRLVHCHNQQTVLN